jgi:hypothetical protein
VLVPEIAELEQRLFRLQADLEWPRTPDLAERVGARIAAPVIVRRPWFQSRWALAAAALLVLLAALVVYTPSREAIANWLNLHTIITRVNQLPTPSPQQSAPIGTRLGLGVPTTLDDARRKVGWTVRVPGTLGAPDEVYYQNGPPQGEVSLVYKSRPGLKVSGQTGVAVLITEVNGKVDANYFGKTLGPGTTLEEVTVNGRQGYWISGSPHDFFFTDAAGTFRNETLRLATNTLIFDDNGTLIRIEGDLTKTQALEIANSLS